MKPERALTRIIHEISLQKAKISAAAEIGKRRNFYPQELQFNFEDNKFRAFSIIADSLALQ